MSIRSRALAFACVLAIISPAAADGIINGGGSGAPSGAAGGGLSGTYPNPTVATNANLTGPITSVGNATSIASQTGTGSTFVMSASPTGTGTWALPIVQATSASLNGATIGSNAAAGVGQFASFGATTTGPGFYSYLTGDTVARVRIGLDTSDMPSLAFGPGGASTRDTFLLRIGAGIIQHGTSDVDAGPVAQTIRTQGALAGGTSNVAGANFTFIVSPGKGTGAGGSFIVQTTPAGSTGTAVNAPITALTINSTQDVAIAGKMTSGGTASGSNLSASAAGFISFSGRAAIESPADGVVRIENNAATNNFVLSAPTALATPTMQHGALDAAVAVPQIVRVQSVVAGTAAANGANWTMIGSLPTGTGTSGDIIFQTGVKTGSGTTQGAATTALTIKGETQNVVANAPIVMKGYTVSTLPAGTIGARAYVTDATACTFLGALTGGAATFCPAVYNGAAWVGG